MKNSRINLRVSKEKHAWLKKYAKKRKMTMTQLLEEFIDRLVRRANNGK